MALSMETPGVVVLWNGDMGKPKALTDLIPLVTESVPAANTQRAYKRSLTEFFAWYERTAAPPFGKAVAQRYLQYLTKSGKAPSTVNQALTALRKLATEAADNGLLDPATAASMNKIKAQKRLGKRTGRWLSTRKATELICTPNLKTLKGKRDRVLLGMLLECGLRREEAATINVEQFQEREGRWLFADVCGKGGKLRTVPIPERCAYRIKEWIKAANIESGRLLRAVDKADHIVSESITAPAIYKQVREYSAEIGTKIAPHDLRRTFARLAYNQKAQIEQLKNALGHSSIKTTEIYLGVNVDLQNAACDVLNLDDRSETEE